MKRPLTLCVPALSLLLAQASAADEPLPEPLRLQVGCFRVTQRFLEPARPFETTTSAIEWLQLSRNEGSFSLNHVGLGGKKPAVLSEDVWTRLSDGSWRLQVYTPDEKLLYFCEGGFVRTRFHCRVPGTPKPGREAKRADYERLDRGIALVMQPQRWVQQETNEKVKKDGSLVALEVGFIEYDRLDEKKCEAAKKEFPQDRM